MNHSTLVLIDLLTGLIWPLTTRAHSATITPAAITSGTQANPVHPEASVPHSKTHPATMASSAPLHHSRKAPSPPATMKKSSHNSNRLRSGWNCAMRIEGPRILTRLWVKQPQGCRRVFMTLVSAVYLIVGYAFNSRLLDVAGGMPKHEVVESAMQHPDG